MWRRRPSTGVGDTISGLRFRLYKLKEKNTQNPFCRVQRQCDFYAEMKVYRVSYQQFYVEEEDTCILPILLSISNPFINITTYNIIGSWYLQFGLTITPHGLYFYFFIVVILYF